MEMGYEYPLYVTNVSAYRFQRLFKHREGFRCIHAGIKKRNAAVMHDCEHVDVLQPEGHGQCDHVKTLGYLFNQLSLVLSFRAHITIFSISCQRGGLYFSCG